MIMKKLLIILPLIFSACSDIPLTKNGAKVTTLDGDEIESEQYEIIGQVQESADKQDCNNSLRNMAAENGAEYITPPKYEYFVARVTGCKAIAAKDCSENKNCRAIKEIIDRPEALTIIETPTVIEPWFILFGFGFGDSRYSRNSINAIQNFTGTEYDDLLTVQFGVEYLKTLRGNSSGLGASLSQTQESFETKDRGLWFSSFRLLSAVFYKYYGGQIGKGIFAKYQLGISNYSLDKDEKTFFERTGASGGLGVGWAHTSKNLGRSILFDLEGHYHYSRDIKKGDYTINMYLMF